MEKKRSTGITILSILFLIGGIISTTAIMGLIVYRQPQELTAESYEQFLSNIPPKERDKLVNSEDFKNMIEFQNKMLKSGLFDYKSMFLFHLTNTISGLAMLILGIGLLRLKEWARKGVVLFYALFTFIWVIVFDIYGIRFFNIVTENHEGFAEAKPPLLIMFGIQNFFMLIIAFIIIYYFTRPKVKAQFKEPNA